MTYINPVDLDNYPRQRIRAIEGLAKDQIGDARHEVTLPPSGFQGSTQVGGWRQTTAHTIGAVLSLVTRL